MNKAPVFKHLSFGQTISFSFFFSSVHFVDKICNCFNVQLQLLKLKGTFSKYLELSLNCLIR